MVYGIWSDHQNRPRNQTAQEPHKTVDILTEHIRFFKYLDWSESGPAADEEEKNHSNRLGRRKKTRRKCHGLV